MKKLLRNREFTLFILVIAIGATITAISPVFIEVRNIGNILNNMVPMGIIACGMTIVIITGGIEVSVASQMVVSSFLVGLVSQTASGNLFFLILTAIGAGLAMGIINGSLIAFLKIPPIIATLGTMNMYRGALLFLTSGKWIMNLPDKVTNITRTTFLGLPISLFIFLVIAIITSLVLKYTSFGRSVFAIGGNSEAAKRTGVNINRTTFFVYIYAGIMCGIAGLVNAARVGNIQPNGSQGLEMLVIAAVIMGGTSILGGSGTILGTALGVLLMGIIDNSLIIVRIPSYWQKVVVGTVIVITITLNIIKKMRSENKTSKVDVL